MVVGRPFDVAFDQGVGVVFFFLKDFLQSQRREAVFTWFRAFCFRFFEAFFQKGRGEEFRQLEGDPEVSGEAVGLHEVVGLAFEG